MNHFDQDFGLKHLNWKISDIQLIKVMWKEL